MGAFSDIGPVGFAAALATALGAAGFAAAFAGALAAGFAPIALAGAALAAAVFVATFSGAEYKFENDIKTHKNSANLIPPIHNPTSK